MRRRRVTVAGMQVERQRRWVCAGSLGVMTTVGACGVGGARVDQVCGSHDVNMSRVIAVSGRATAFGSVFFKCTVIPDDVIRPATSIVMLSDLLLLATTVVAGQYSSGTSASVVDNM
jgi:hypothetical protein